MTWRNCSGVSRVAGTAVPMPALLTSTSTRPSSCIAASTSALARLGVGDVGLHGERPAAGGLDERRGLLEPVDPAGAEHHVGAGLGEGLGERDAEPGGGAGDDRHLAVETEQVEHGHGQLLRQEAGQAAGQQVRRWRACQALAHHVVDGVPHLPVEVARGELAGGDDPGRVAGAARVRSRA